MVREAAYFIAFILIVALFVLFFVVDGRQGHKGIENIITNGDAVVGFYVRRVHPRTIMDIADAGKLLPPKVAILLLLLLLFFLSYLLFSLFLI
jgi:hypothetical protein